MVGGVAFLTSLGVCLLTGQAYGAPNLFQDATNVTKDSLLATPFATSLLGRAARVAGARSATVGLFDDRNPSFVEKIFDVQTDISLLELGDAAHPLLQELVRRAPGTYNHSINVASIGEAAAEAIGANGLLVRVGAYFHDIGKMLKPAYFIENQGQDVNRHTSLLPAMSTLVIIAHVKDGANLAAATRWFAPIDHRFYRTASRHHSVEYFYRQAAKQCEVDPDASEVDETFVPLSRSQATNQGNRRNDARRCRGNERKPHAGGPHAVGWDRKPGSGRSPAMKRLLDGQFEESGLTLQEVQSVIEESLRQIAHRRLSWASKVPRPAAGMTVFVARLCLRRLVLVKLYVAQTSGDNGRSVHLRI